jgi:hypothetical protein
MSQRTVFLATDGFSHEGGENVTVHATFEGAMRRASAYMLDFRGRVGSAWTAAPCANNSDDFKMYVWTHGASAWVRIEERALLA